jgi:hypothetical protein
MLCLKHPDLGKAKLGDRANIYPTLIKRDVKAAERAEAPDARDYMPPKQLTIPSTGKKRQLKRLLQLPFCIKKGYLKGECCSLPEKGVARSV